MSSSKKALLLVAMYVVLVLASALTFQAVRPHMADGEPHPIYGVFGPALSLFTHMSYGLLALQTVFFIPWIAGIATMKPPWHWFAGVLFVATWLACGFWMFDLF